MTVLAFAIEEAERGEHLRNARVLMPREADPDVVFGDGNEAELLRNGIWPEGLEFAIHGEPEMIVDYVVHTYLPHLETFRIVTVFMQQITPLNGRRRLGTATKLPGKMRFLANFDAVVTLDFSIWRVLTDRDRQRLIHHELEHLTINPKTGRLAIRPHDFEDFASIVDLYGLRSESASFSTDGRSAAALSRAAQLELIPGGAR